VLAAACGATAFLCLVLPPPVRNAAASALRGTIVAPLVSMQARAEHFRHVLLTDDSTMRVADSVALRSQRLTGVEEENERLRTLLGLAAGLKWGFIPAEALQGRALGDDFTVTLSAGTDAGVEPLLPVVTTEGLVGMVERADKSLSLAIFWPHPDFRVSAMTADGGAFGIVAGHGGSGAEKYFLELQSVPLRSPLKAGALVVSSGLGGVYPRGIPIGLVVSELKTSVGFARNYLVKPVVSLPDISSVFVLTPERVRAGVPNVWAAGANVDSARKAIVAAADSMHLRRDTVPKPAARRDTLAKPATKHDTSAGTPPKRVP